MAHVAILLAGCDQQAIEAAKWVESEITRRQARTINDEMAKATVYVMTAFNEDDLTVAQKREFDKAMQGIKCAHGSSFVAQATLIVAPTDAVTTRPWTEDWVAALTQANGRVHRYAFVEAGRSFTDHTAIDRLFPETWLAEGDLAHVLPEQPRVRLPKPVDLELPGQAEVVKKGSHAGVSQSDAVLCVLAEQERPELPLGTALAVQALRWRETNETEKYNDAGHWRLRMVKRKAWGDGDSAEIGHLTSRSEAAYAAIPEVPLHGPGSGFAAEWDGKTNALRVGGTALDGQWMTRRVRGDYGGDSPSAFSPSIRVPVQQSEPIEQSVRLQDIANHGGLCRYGGIFLRVGEKPLPFEFVDASRCITLTQLLPAVRKCLQHWRANFRRAAIDERHKAWASQENGGGEIVARLAEGIWRAYCPWPEPFTIRNEEGSIVEPSTALTQVKVLFKTLYQAPLQSSPPNLVANFLSVIQYPQYDMHAWASEFEGGWHFKLKTRDHYWIEGMIQRLPEELKRTNRALQAEILNSSQSRATLVYRDVYCLIHTDSTRL